MTISSAKEAREIIANGMSFKDEDNVRFVFSKGYLSALQGQEVRALVEALESMENHCCECGDDEVAKKALSLYREAVKND